MLPRFCRAGSGRSFLRKGRTREKLAFAVLPEALRPHDGEDGEGAEKGVMPGDRKETAPEHDAPAFGQTFGLRKEACLIELKTCSS